VCRRGWLMNDLDWKECLQDVKDEYPSVGHSIERHIDALAARCAELTDLLSRCSTDCNQLSHRLGEYHEYDEACPVAMKIERALTTRADE